MGEIAEMMQEGLLCEVCGVFIDMGTAGVPRRCNECLLEACDDALGMDDEEVWHELRGDV
jgi:hypothetical protein